MRLHEQILKTGKTKKEIAQEVKTDAPMLSRFINYKCLPIPTMMDDICKVLGCDVEDIYDANEISFTKKKKAKRKTENYKLTVELPKEARDFLKRNIKKCGYRDITDWIMKCFLRLKKRYEIICEYERKKASQEEKPQS